ncbi:MAG: alpha/beta fold hydrolase, partial [Deferrisomatales bacterium]
MIAPVYVPRWGVTMEEATVVAWHARLGERVAKGQDLVELETEKMVNVVPAPGDGVLQEVLVPEGDVARVGDLLGVVAEAGEAYDLAELRRPRDAGGAAAAVRRERARAPAQATARGRVRASPAARRLAEPLGLDLAGVEGTGPEGSVGRADVERAVAEAVGPTLEEGTADAGGVRLHYLAAGGAGTGLRCRPVPVVLVHGLAGSTALWQLNLTALAARQRVIALDLPGHGLSDKPPADYSVGFFAQTLGAFLAAQGLDRVFLVGHSLGGHACLRLALDDPDRVAGLVLVASGGLGGEPNLDSLEPLLAGLGREAVVRMLRALFHDPALATGAMAEATLRLLSQPGAWEAVASAASLGRRDGSEAARLGALRLPVLLAWGAEDAIVP